MMVELLTVTTEEKRNLQIHRRRKQTAMTQRFKRSLPAWDTHVETVKPSSAPGRSTWVTWDVNMARYLSDYGDLGSAYLSWSLNILLHKGKFWKLISYSLSLSFGRFWRSIHADSVKSPSAPRTVFVDTIVSNIKGCGRYTPVREYSWTHHQMCAPSKSWVPDLFCAEAHHPTLH